MGARRGIRRGDVTPVPIARGPAASGAIADDGESTPTPMSDPIGDPIVVAGPTFDAESAAGVIEFGITVGVVTGMGDTGTCGATALNVRGRGWAGVGLGVPRAGGGAMVGMKGNICFGA